MKAVKYYLGSNHTFAQTGEIFAVGATTVRSWIVQYEETGDVSNKPLNREFKKIDPVKLRAYCVPLSVPFLGGYSSSAVCRFSGGFFSLIISTHIIVENFSSF